MDLDDIKIEHVFMFLVILIGATIVIGIIAAAVIHSQERENSQKPLQKKRVRVLEKMPNTQLDVFLVFETEDGERVRLNTEKYLSLVVGDYGTLTWQGKRLISFEIEKEE